MRPKKKETDRSPVHPGEILLEEFMKPLGLSQNALARALGVPPGRVGEIVNERRGISGDTALRLERYFGSSAEMWLGVQMQYELDCAQGEVGAEIRRAVRPREPA